MAIFAVTSKILFRSLRSRLNVLYTAGEMKRLSYFSIWMGDDCAYQSRDFQNTVEHVFASSGSRRANASILIT